MENTLPKIYLARPNLREPDSYLLEVIGALPSQGKSSRLYQGLVTDLERGRDTGIAAHTHARRGDALLLGLLSSQQRHLGGRGGYHRRGGPGQAASPTRRLAHGRHPHDDVRLRLRAGAADDHHRPADRAGQHRPRSRGHQPGEPRLLCAQRDELPPRRGSCSVQPPQAAELVIDRKNAVVSTLSAVGAPYGHVPVPAEWRRAGPGRGKAMAAIGSGVSGTRSPGGTGGRAMW